MLLPKVRTQLRHVGTRGGVGRMGEGRAGALRLEGGGLGDHASPRAMLLEGKHPDGLCTVPKSTDLPQTLW